MARTQRTIEMDWKTMNKPLKDLRLSLVMGRAELAEELGISYRMIQEIELGNSNPSWETLNKYMIFFNVKFLLHGTGTKRNRNPHKRTKK